MIIHDKLQYQKAIVKRAYLNGQPRTTDYIMELGILNNAIAEWEERQTQMPDLSFITDNAESTPEEVEKSFETMSKKQLASYIMAVGLIPKMVKRLIHDAETDPEAMELLQTIAKPLK